MAENSKLQNKSCNISANDTSTLLKSDEKRKFSIFDTINVNTLGYFYNKDDSLFKKRVDKLNIRFYLESDKFLNHKQEMDKSQDNLFLLLFKQVSLYIEEIERLNNKLKEKEETEKYKKFKLEEIIKKESADKEINYYKSTIRNLDKKNLDFKLLEDKLKKENESYKRQLLFYKDKLKLQLSSKKMDTNMNTINLFNTLPNKNNKSEKSKSPDFRTATANQNSNCFKMNVIVPTETKNDCNLNIISLTDNNLSSYNICEANPKQDLKKSPKFNFSEIKRIISVSLDKGKETAKERNLTENNEANNQFNNKTKRKFSPINKSFNADNYQIIEKKKQIRINNINLSQSRNNTITNSRFLNSDTHNQRKNQNKIPFSTQNNRDLNFKTMGNVDEDNLKSSETFNQPQFNISLRSHNKQLNDFANLLRQNIQEELELLDKEEEVLLNLKNQIGLTSNENGFLNTINNEETNQTSNTNFKETNETGFTNLNRKRSTSEVKAEIKSNKHSKISPYINSSKYRSKINSNSQSRTIDINKKKNK